MCADSQHSTSFYLSLLAGGPTAIWQKKSLILLRYILCLIRSLYVITNVSIWITVIVYAWFFGFIIAWWSYTSSELLLSFTSQSIATCTRPRFTQSPSQNSSCIITTYNRLVLLFTYSQCIGSDLHFIKPPLSLPDRRPSFNKDS